MKVTVCELSDDKLQFLEDWAKLKIHLEIHKPGLLLLPELPFGNWVPSTKEVSHAVKIQSVEKHEWWLKEIERLDVACTVYTKPVIDGDRFFNTACVYEHGIGHRKLHTKCFFPEEDNFWEETWYDADPKMAFETIDIGGVKMGALLCTEMWFTQYGRHYGKQGIDILLCPRATGAGSVAQWIRCGQTLSVISGAYCLSSNRSGSGENNFKWGGNGWITEPITGNLAGTTSNNEKFITREIDIDKSRAAKNDYPLYVKD
jgi:predicted amidohydrolase